MAIDVSRQVAFIGVRDGNQMEASRQAAFVAVRDTNKLEVSRQVAFIGVRPNAVPYPPNLQFRPSAMRLAIEARPEDVKLFRRGGATVLKARIPVTFVIT